MAFVLHVGGIGTYGIGSWHCPPGDSIVEDDSLREDVDADVSWVTTRDLTEEEHAAYFGEIEEVAADPEVDDDIASLKVADLKALCTQRGIEFPSSATKADLIALLSDYAESDAGDDPEPETDPEPDADNEAPLLGA